MIVYGDSKRVRPVAALLPRAAAEHATSDQLARHAQLVRQLTELGQLAQGLADAGDGHRPELDPLMLAAAAAVEKSFTCGLADAPPVGAVASLSGIDLPERIEVTDPEGYAYYAVYPELYISAARTVADISDDWTVIGIRSIGTSLAAVVAAALGAARCVTVRPTGHPFARALHPADYERSVLLAGRGAFAIVDEGPGLSGSSFEAVARWLEQNGVAPERIVIFPSHGGEPGVMASNEARARWRSRRRVWTSFDAVFLDPAAPLSLASIVGAPGVEPLELGGGTWRSVLFDDEGRWPGVNVQHERRKYLFRIGGDAWLAKFSGIGARGEEAFERARALGDARLSPAVLAQRHGFLVSRWIDGARTVRGARASDRAQLFDTVARYLAFRAPWTTDQRGAPPRRLVEMTAFNAGDAWRALEATCDEVEEAAVPIVTDNKMEAWEWIVAPDGEILKSDAVDHHAGHDLIGCQDLAWDLVGAVIELDASEREAEDLIAAVQRATGRAWSPRVLHFTPSAISRFATATTRSPRSRRRRRRRDCAARPSGMRRGSGPWGLAPSLLPVRAKADDLRERPSARHRASRCRSRARH